MKTTSCNLDLSLFSYSISSPSQDTSPLEDDGNVNEQQVTIFHKGRSHCVCDTTELRARCTLIWLARREMEKRVGGSTALGCSATSLSLQGQALLYGSRGVSLKRSLQTFLQNRKRRTY